MKRFMAGTLIFTSLFSNCVFAENIEVNGNKIDTEAVNSEERILVPIRGVFEELGYNVSWDIDSKMATLTNNDKTVTIKEGESSFYVNGIEIKPEVPQEIIEERFYIPLRAIAEAIGAKVEWDENTMTAKITSGNEVKKDDDKKDTKVAAEFNTFDGKLYEQMTKEKNYMFSPISIKMALAMAANGADGDTKAEILKTLDIEDIDKFNEEMKGYIEQYHGEFEESTEETTAEIDNIDYEKEYEKSKPVLNFANSIWLNADYIKNVDFSDEFKNSIEENYNGEVKKVNNANAVDDINSWVAKNTNNKIKKIIEDNKFLSALINAVYFKGTWVNEFDKNATHKDNFTGRDGKKTEIDFMNQTDHFYYYKDNEMEMVKMPYLNSDVSMYIALADDNRLDFVSKMDKMEYKKVNLNIPKFKIEFETEINDMLTSLGMVKAFDEEDAELKNMFKGDLLENPYISSILHKTYIDVDEEGTEAAAVTAILVETTGMPVEEEIVDFKADKPFSYIIRDDKTGEILFMGEYAFAK